MVSANYPEQDATGRASVRVPTSFLLRDLDVTGPRFTGAPEVPPPEQHGGGGGGGEGGDANGSKAISRSARNSRVFK